YWYNAHSRTVEFPHIAYNDAEDELYIPQGMFNSMAKDLGLYDRQIGGLKVARPFKDQVVLNVPKIEVAPVAVPATSKAAPSATGTLKVMMIVVEAGHGGKDPCGIGVNDIYEKEIALSVALKVQKQLEALGAKVVMTRSTDVFLELEERSSLANNSNA